MNIRIINSTFLLAVSGTASSLAIAVCSNLPQPDLTEEINRIKVCADENSESPKPAEQILYSYSVKDKVDDILNMERGPFNAKYNAQQDRLDELRLRMKYGIRSPEFLTKAQNIAIAFKHNAKNIQDEFNKTRQPDELELFGFATSESVYPGFLDRYSLELDIANKEATVKKLREKRMQAADAMEGAKYDGLILAYTIFELIKFDPMVDPVSNQSAGKGLYLANSPSASLTHFRESGVACRVPTGDKSILPIYRIDGVILPEVSPVANFTGYNLFAWPAAAEQGTEGKLVSWGNPRYYVSKNVFDQKANCRLVQIDDFGSCSDFSALLPDQGQDELLKFLKESAGPVKNVSTSFDSKFFAIWNRCAIPGEMACALSIRDSINRMDNGKTLKNLVNTNASAYRTIKASCQW